MLLARLVEKMFKPVEVEMSGGASTKSLQEDMEMKEPFAAKKVLKRKRTESSKKMHEQMDKSTFTVRLREDIEREEPFARSIGMNFVVYARRPDVSDTLIVRDTSRKGTFTAFGIKGIETIKNVFHAATVLVTANLQLLDDARFELDKKFNTIIEAQSKMVNSNKNNELLAVANDNAVFINIYNRNENDEALTSVTIDNVKISLVTNRKHPQMAFHLLHEDTKKVKAGIYMHLWDVEKLLRYMQERFSIISGLAFNVYENVQSSLVNCDNDDFF